MTLKNDKVTLGDTTYLLTKRYLQYMLPNGPLKESDDKIKWEDCKIESIDNNTSNKTRQS
jgi:hypothetical protein